MDIQTVLKRMTCLVQISNDEMKKINDPVLEPSFRSLRLANLIKDKRIDEEVYKMLCDLYCITEIMQKDSPGCYSILVQL